MLRTFFLSAAAVAVTLTGAITYGSEAHDFNIPAGELAPALEMLAKETGLELIFQPGDLKGIRTHGVTGRLSPEEAVNQLVGGTHLSVRKDSAGAILISSMGSEPKTSAANTREQSGLNVAQIGASTTNSTSSPANAAAAGAQNDSSGDTLSEVIVTARKRTERLEDVPVAVSVIGSSTMVDQGAVNLQDYYVSVPGLSITDQGSGRLSITMRGLSSGGGYDSFTNPTVGITIDDVPIGATDTAIIVGSQFVPQLDPADLERIEFLKGPQGTLYGASSLAGVMRYVTAVPNLETTSGRIEVDGSKVDNGGAGYGVRGSANIPIIVDTLAMRVSAFDRRDPGFVDDPFQGRSNVNSVDSYGTHLALLYQATPAFSARVSALIQRTEGNGDGTIDTNYLYQPLYGPLDHSRLPGTGQYDYYNQLYSATLNYRSSLFDFVSITGYGITRNSETQDATPLYGGTGAASLSEAFYNVAGSALVNYFQTKKFTQEVRLSSLPGPLEWQVGAFYTYEDNDPNRQQILANDPSTGVDEGLVANLYFPTTFTEYAGFANLTYHFTDQFNVQVGGRESHNSQRFHQDYTGPLIEAVTSAPDVLTNYSSDSAFTYLVTPQFQLTPTQMIYARIASGYQAGGPNTPFTPDTPLPPKYDPSTTVNYELGIKSRLLQHRLSIDADIFYISWSKIQLTGLAPVSDVSYVFNGGHARSEGLELSIQYEPIDNLTLGTSIAYTDAILTNSAGNGFPGVAGDPLPFSSKWTANLSVDKRFKLSNAATGFFGLSGSYVGRRYEGFPADVGLPQPVVPSYTYGNGHVGVEIQGFTVSAYVKNFTNDRGILSSAQWPQGTTLNSGVWRTAIITPRTVGLSVSKTF